MSSGIAVSIVPGELRLLVARTNGSVQPLHQLSAELPEAAVHAGLRAPNVAEPGAVIDALSSLVDEAEADLLQLVQELPRHGDAHNNLAAALAGR